MTVFPDLVRKVNRKVTSRKALTDCVVLQVEK